MTTLQPIKPKRALDLLGQRFGRLTVIAFAGIRNRGKSSQHTSWTCRCECGSVYDYNMGTLRAGTSTQCRECGLKAMRKGGKMHGMSHTPIYDLWRSLKGRSSLCIEWQTFETFQAEVGNQPGGKYLRRLDPRKLFGLGNVVWLTADERKAIRLERKVDEYVALTGEDREIVLDRFRRVTRERRRQLLLKAKGICWMCHGTIIWLGEDEKACLCSISRGPRRRHWRERIILRLQKDEGMSMEEANLIMTGCAYKVPGAKMAIPFNFRERCLTVSGVDELAAHYGVCAQTVRKWIKRLKLKRKLIYVDSNGTDEAVS